MSLTRRQVLKYGTFATAGATLFGTQSLLAPRSMAATTLTGVTYLPDSYKALTYGSNRFVEMLQENGGDLLNVDFHDSGQLLKVDEQLPALRARSIDFMFHTFSYITRSIPILGVTGLPGVVGELYRNPERLRQGSPLMELINEVLAEENLYMLTSGGGILEPEYLWSTEGSPIRNLDDVRGKKIRIVGFEATQAFEKYNVGATRIPSSETYMALQRGTVDAGIFNISTIIGRSLQEQLQYCYKLPITGFSVAPFMLRDTWDRLDDETRAIIQQAADWYDANFIDHCNNDIYPNEYWPMVEEAGIEIIEPTEEDLDTFNAGVEEVWDMWKEEVGQEVGDRAIALALGQA
ncbi:TRAP transporter substrate-binding protein [Halomonas urumqiensis]|uniref:C4-dicarboxylate ABC transporter substrate-binding protein n=1 Tax=Halomonas urumqiensis TaxID=1684789 RepID=A0A2N7UD28_9GAMM|nr:TRAP transporter substrate-binding protein DctP [Halomonas urumqiensis]PMR78330.1 C4-dicarboxylate ABC transporter substrate-binding protein [Halomonas urumqiensis]PTB03477.1 C4-dicarboxylate ABC transporter substrate-binding protein [Halomonas urumqiensis]GHE20337.1 ABC transporter substrate-binding protein [Halomonas urumqiensis]